MACCEPCAKGGGCGESGVKTTGPTHLIDGSGLPRDTFQGWVGPPDIGHRDQPKETDKKSPISPIAIIMVLAVGGFAFWLAKE